MAENQSIDVRVYYQSLTNEKRERKVPSLPQSEVRLSHRNYERETQREQRQRITSR